MDTFSSLNMAQPIAYVMKAYSEIKEKVHGLIKNVRIEDVVAANVDECTLNKWMKTVEESSLLFTKPQLCDDSASLIHRMQKIGFLCMPPDAWARDSSSERFNFGRTMLESSAIGRIFDMTSSSTEIMKTPEACEGFKRGASSSSSACYVCIIPTVKPLKVALRPFSHSHVVAYHKNPPGSAAAREALDAIGNLHAMVVEVEDMHILIMHPRMAYAILTVNDCECVVKMIRMKVEEEGDDVSTALDPLDLSAHPDLESALSFDVIIEMVRT